MTVSQGPLLLAKARIALAKALSERSPCHFECLPFVFSSEHIPFVISSERSESRNLFAVDGADGKAGVAVGVGVELRGDGGACAGKERRRAAKKLSILMELSAKAASISEEERLKRI